MRKQIEIIEMEQYENDGKYNVVFDIVIAGHKYKFQYIIDGPVANVPRVCDSVVVTFLFFAIKYDMDVVSSIPITEKLYHNIRTQIIPQVVKCDQKAHSIDIHMPITNEKYCGKWNGTGISLGVDSFATIHQYGSDCELEDYKITHLVHLKTGAHHGCGKKDEQELFLAENNRVRRYCEKYNYNLITIETNLHKICQERFGDDFDTTHICRNLGAILLLQNYFGKYYYASTSNLDHFRIDINKDIAYCEKWLIPVLSNDNIDFYSANLAMMRSDKVKYISDFPDTYEFLHVCWSDEKNCGECRKCIRTMVQLDLAGKLDRYTESFDVEKYYAERKRYLRTVAAMRTVDVYFREIYDEMKCTKGVKIPGFFETNYTRVVMGLKALKNLGLKTFISRFH